MIVNKPVISSVAAMQLVQDAVAYAGLNGWGICAAVVDAQGSLLALWRMEGVSPAIVEFASDKAYTAAVMKCSSAELVDGAQENLAGALGLANRARLLSWGGGLPIVHEGRVVGGIGVSGVKDFEDIACAKAALEAAGLGGEV